MFFSISALTCCIQYNNLPLLLKKKKVRMSKCHIYLLFVILSNECDNQLYMVMLHLNTEAVFVTFSDDITMGFSPLFCFYFFIGSAYLL